LTIAPGRSSVLVKDRLSPTLTTIPLENFAGAPEAAPASTSAQTVRAARIALRMISPLLYLDDPSSRAREHQRNLRIEAGAAGIRAGRGAPTMGIELPTRLVVRESTACPGE
jgi:hypothetical protein